MPAHPSSIQRLFKRLRQGGLAWAASALRERCFPHRPSFHAEACSALTGGRVLEIGGPSRLFRTRGALPVYGAADRVDNVNFSATTAWESRLQEGGAFEFRRGRQPGTQYLREAGTLHGFKDEGYDAVISSHCLEHLADPLGALNEWRRVCRNGGLLLLVLPDPRHTFDHRRPITLLEHLLADRAAERPETDETHFAEVLALHDLSLDPAAGSPEEFRERVHGNTTHRCVHHHVFDGALMEESLRHTGWVPIAVEAFAPLHLGALARKGTP